jgi:hypothetical protein
MKRRKIIGVFIVLLLAFTFILPYTIVSADDTVQVVVKPTLRASLAEYDITFVTKADLIGGKDNIIIRFPEGTKLPCSCPHNWHRDFFSINGYEPTRAGRVLDIPNTIYLQVAGGITIKAGSTVNVVLKQQSNIWNPSKPGKYQLTVWTTRQGKMKSNFYEITSTHLTDLSVSVSPNTAGLIAEYRINFTTGDLGNLNNGQKIYVEFPEGTKFPDTLNKSSILINGFNPKKVELDGTTLALTLKRSINKDRKCELIIKGSFGITNPVQGGMYSLYIWTDNEPEKVKCEFTLTQEFTVSTHMDTLPESPDGINGYFKTIPLVTLKGETNLDNTTVKTFYKIDEGKFSEYTAPFKMPEGVHTLYYYSSAGELTEKVQSMVFKVDATAPILTIVSPDKNPYATRLSSIKISGKTNEDCAIDINGKPALEKKDFSFSKEIKLLPGENNITVSAVDIAGNVTRVNLKISYDTTVPQITIAVPADWEEITTKEITVKGTVSPVSSVLYINEEQVNVSEDGSFIYSFAPKANVQILPIKLRAVYPVSGKSAEKTLTVIYKPQMKKVFLTIGKKTAVINKSKKEMDVAPFIDKKTNRTLVPVRFVVEFLGGTVQWDAKTRTVTIELNGKTVKLTINSTTAYVDGVPYTLDQPPIIKGNRTFIPLRFVVEALGFNVQWNGKTHMITIQAP